MADFREITPQEIAENPFKLIGGDWALVTAGDRERFNTMTISWGGMGIMWNKPVVFSFIRPQRYTFEFTEQNDRFTMSFFDEEYRKALAFCGSKSGRDMDKIAVSGLTPVEGRTVSVPALAEFPVTLECRVLYRREQDLGLIPGKIRAAMAV